MAYVSIACLGKRELNRARRREAIVCIAHQAFLENGYAATSMSAIADQVGGSKTTLWSCFASKEELFVAVVDHLVEGFQRELEDVLTVRQFSRSALRRLLVRLCLRLLEPQAIQLTRLIVGESGRFPEISRIFFERGPSKLQARVRDFFATRYEAEQADELARLCLAAILGFRWNALLHPPEHLRSDMENFVTSLLDNLRLGDFCEADGSSPDPN